MFLQKSNRLALVDPKGNKVSHSELVDKVKYFSKYVIKETEDIQQFNVIMMENRKEWLYTFYAIWDKKNVPLVIDSESSIEEIVYFLKDSNATSIYVSNKTYEKAKETINVLGREIFIENIDDVKIDENKLEEISKDERILLHPEGEELAIMLYTSGTTGDPKGVMLTFNNIEAQIESIKSLMIIEENEQVLAGLPFHHILPLMTTNLLFMHYSTQFSIVFIENLSSQDILKALNDNDVTILSMVPRVYKLFYSSIKSKIDSKVTAKNLFKLAQKAQNISFSRTIFSKIHKTFGGKLTRVISGGAKTDKEIADFFDTIGIEYFEGYGLSETSPVVACSTTKHGKKNGTVGRKVDNIEVKLVDGELWVKGLIVMKGYYNKPEETAKVITEDGWFKTGDLAEIDDEGFITIKGRKNSMIVLSNGKNIDPEKLENRLIQYSNEIIKEIGIFAKNDKLAALIVIDDKKIKEKGIINIKPYIEDTISFYNASSHGYEKVLEYKMTEAELPKTRIGKLKRFMLKDIYLGHMKDEQKEKVEEPDTLEYKVLKEYIFNMKNEYAEPNVNLEIEFGLDSLDQVELLSFIERSFGVKLTNEEFKENITLIKLSELIKNKSEKFIETKDQWKEIIKNAPVKELENGSGIRFLRPLGWLIFKIYFRLSIKGKENIDNEPQIFIANHASFLDALALNLLLPKKVAKNTYSLAIDWYFKSKFMRKLAKETNLVLLDIDGNIRETIEQIASVLKQGKNVFIFPEGTRTKDGNLSPFKKTFAIISKEMDVKVTCLKIDGTFEAYSRYDKYPKPKKITVSYLGEINPENLSYDEIVDKARNMYN
ncbi:AMP-binding protein [Streptobacillus moniliformis]|uniref:AMP-binding protein n=1 Tax=Streptobacillus moniliformis TaxID=34105 RepID=UPI0007E4CD51|nr:AMP-binding protein [Streptobacillus moniliformis]